MIKNKIEQLVTTCNIPIEDFRSLGDVADTEHGQLVYIDRGAPVLAVAHLDWVGYQPAKITNKRITCEQLDDRLGAWMLLHYLPSIGFHNYDILLTDSEEVGNSTAQHFETNKQYNWLFEFDRAGSDVVMYDYETRELGEMLGEYNWKTGLGSFSDISYLEHLNCKAFNFGVGYHRQHSPQCYAEFSEVFANANRFIPFANDFVGELLPHEKQPTNDWYSDDGWMDEDTTCGDCGELLAADWAYCPHCGAATFQAYTKWS